MSMSLDPYSLKPEDKEAYINALINKMQEDNNGGDKEYQRQIAERIWELRMQWYSADPDKVTPI